MKVSIVIPTKNEHETIQRVIESCKPYADELLVVDGHSTDATREIATECGARVVLDQGRGKGDGIRAGIQHATGDVIVFIDADLSHEARDIPALVEMIAEQGYDLVVGSRKTGGSDELHGSLSEFIRLFGSGIITMAINYRFRVRLTDSQNGFRAIRRSMATRIDLKEKIHTIEQEMLIKVLKAGGRTAEVPSHEFKRLHGQSTVSVPRVAHRYVWSVIKNIF